MSAWSLIYLRIKSIALLPTSFWLICTICILLYGTVIPFNNIASDFLMSKWYPNDIQMAGFVMGIPDTISATLVPLCGYLIDRIGQRPHILAICGITIAIAHLTLGLTMTTPILPLIALGLSFAMYGVAIWPSVAIVIEHAEVSSIKADPNMQSEADSEAGIAATRPHQPKLLGTAFGVSTSALNASFTLFPILTAQIRVAGGSFVPVEMFFAGMALLGVLR
eukprot:jgi/Hompol1/2025/HPOL_005819-RA